MTTTHTHPNNHDHMIVGEKIEIGTRLQKTDFYASSDGTWKEGRISSATVKKDNSHWVRPDDEWLSNFRKRAQTISR